jgi:hypothetical protein
MQDAAVLGGDAVDETQVTGDAPELVENPAGDENDLDPVVRTAAIASPISAPTTLFRAIVPS